jgi:hypothetical protein
MSLIENYAWVDALLSFKYNQYAFNSETANDFTEACLIGEDNETQDTALLARKQERTPIIIYVPVIKRRMAYVEHSTKRMRCQSPIPAFVDDEDDEDEDEEDDEDEDLSNVMNALYIEEDNDLSFEFESESEDDWAPQGYSAADLDIDWEVLKQEW